MFIGLGSGMMNTGSATPTLGPNLVVGTFTNFGAPNWTYTPYVMTKATSAGVWGGINSVIAASVATYELSITVTGSNSGGTVTPALGDNSVMTNSGGSLFSSIAGNLANGTYVGRATSAASNQALGFFSGAWQGTITINYLRLVL